LIQVGKLAVIETNEEHPTAVPASLMSDSHHHGPPKAFSKFSLPSLEELENQKAQEDAEEPEIFWEPKRLKLAGR